jgi:hypothetical protein
MEYKKKVDGDRIESKKKMEKLEYGVTQIIATRKVNNQVEVLVQWAATWEPLTPVITKGKLWQEYLEDNKIESEDEEEPDCDDDDNDVDEDPQEEDDERSEEEVQKTEEEVEEEEEEEEEVKAPRTRKRQARSKN